MASHLHTLITLKRKKCQRRPAPKLPVRLRTDPPQNCQGRLAPPIYLIFNSKTMSFITALILFFSFEQPISWRDRLHYLWQLLWQSTPLIVLYKYLCAWHEHHQSFLGALLCVCLLQMCVGAIYHLRRGSFQIDRFLMKNSLMLLQIGAVYLLLASLEVPLGDSLVTEVFESSLQAMTLLYPVSKAVKHIFILSKGKYPPQWIIAALYQYEKNGKLKDFFQKFN